MTSDRGKRRPGQPTAKPAPHAGSSGAAGTLLSVACAGGEWLSAGELRDRAIAALATSDEVVLNLGGVDHLDCSALQVLLALSVAQRQRGRQLQILNLSASLRQWLECAGAAEHFPSIGPSPSGEKGCA
jgi:anti-anti-sigma factor